MHVWQLKPAQGFSWEHCPEAVFPRFFRIIAASFTLVDIVCLHDSYSWPHRVPFPSGVQVSAVSACKMASILKATASHIRRLLKYLRRNLRNISDFNWEDTSTLSLARYVENNVDLSPDIVAARNVSK